MTKLEIITQLEKLTAELKTLSMEEIPAGGLTYEVTLEIPVGLKVVGVTLA